MTIVKDIHFHGVVRPLRVTFATAKGQKDVMQSVIVRVILADGISDEKFKAFQLRNTSPQLLNFASITPSIP